MALKQQHKTRWHGHKWHKMGLIVSGLGNPVMATLRQISLIKNPASVTLLWAVQSVFMVFPTFTGKSCIWKAKSLYGLVPQETFFQCVNSIISQAIVSKVKSLKRIGAQLQMKKNQPVNLKKTHYTSCFHHQSEYALNWINCQTSCKLRKIPLLNKNLHFLFNLLPVFPITCSTATTTKKMSLNK